MLFQFPSLYILSEKCPAVGYCYGTACNHQWLIFFMCTLAANESFLPCKNKVNGEVMGLRFIGGLCVRPTKENTHMSLCARVYGILIQSARFVIWINA